MNGVGTTYNAMATSNNLLLIIMSYKVGNTLFGGTCQQRLESVVHSNSLGGKIKGVGPPEYLKKRMTNIDSNTLS